LNENIVNFVSVVSCLNHEKWSHMWQLFDDETKRCQIKRNVISEANKFMYFGQRL